MDKQLDIFGNEVGVDIIEKQFKHRKTIKAVFRRAYGFKEGFRCKDCKHFEKTGQNNKTYYKCTKLGISGGPGTDIRLKDIACNLWEDKG